MIYTSKTTYVDKQTGEKLSKQTAEKNYIKIKTTPHATTKWAEGTCHIEYTVICERNRQTKLFD